MKEREEKRRRQEEEEAQEEEEDEKTEAEVQAQVDAISARLKKRQDAIDMTNADIDRLDNINKQKRSQIEHFYKTKMKNAESLMQKIHEIESIKLKINEEEEKIELMKSDLAGFDHRVEVMTQRNEMAAEKQATNFETNPVITQARAQLARKQTQSASRQAAINERRTKANIMAEELAQKEAECEIEKTKVAKVEELVKDYNPRLNEAASMLQAANVRFDKEVTLK